MKTEKFSDEKTIAVGHYLEDSPEAVAANQSRTLSSEPSQSTQITCDDPELLPHIGRPWINDWIERHTGIPASSQRPNLLPTDFPALPASYHLSGDCALIPDQALHRHALAVGTTGSGKTRFAVHLAVEQLRLGYSVVAIDPKDQTVSHLLDAARRAELLPEQVTTLFPQKGYPPAWNPLDALALSTPAEQVVKDFVTVVRDTSDSWGHRLQDILTNGLLLIAAHRLSLYELVRLLRNDAYRAALLRKPPEPETVDEETYQEVLEYFREEFDRMADGPRRDAVSPVLNKIREALRSPFLRAMFCATRKPIDLSSLWQKQRLIAIHLDFVGLGDDAALLLGGLITHQLFRTAMRVGGKGGIPVVLFLDEIGLCQKFLGSAIHQILGMARSQDLRLLAACQYLDQLAPDLRSALLSLTSVQAFFRLSRADAVVVAGSVDTGERQERMPQAPALPRRIILSVASRDRRAGTVERLSARYKVVDLFGAPLRLVAGAQAAIERYATFGAKERLKALENLIALSPVIGPPCADLSSGKTKSQQQPHRVPLRDLLYEVPERDWKMNPLPDGSLVVEISYPRPRASVVTERGGAASEPKIESLTTRRVTLEGKLANLPRQQALLSLPSLAMPGVISVTNVPDAETRDGRYLNDVLVLGGQSAKEITDALVFRRVRATEMTEVAVASGDLQNKISTHGKPAKRSTGEPRVIAGRNDGNSTQLTMDIAEDPPAWKLPNWKDDSV